MSNKYPYDAEQAEKVLKEIATTDKGIYKICEQDGFPCSTAFYTWLAEDLENLDNRYTRAREAQSELMAQKIMDTAMNPGLTAGEINRDRLIIDSLKWIAAKLKPKKYGDNQQVNHTGSIQVEQLVIQRTPKTIEHSPEIRALPVIDVNSIDNVQK